jgi:hypothetical protein
MVPPGDKNTGGRSPDRTPSFARRDVGRPLPSLLAICLLSLAFVIGWLRR